MVFPLRFLLESLGGIFGTSTPSSVLATVAPATQCNAMQCPKASPPPSWHTVPVDALAGAQVRLLIADLVERLVDAEQRPLHHRRRSCGGGGGVR